MKKTSMLLTLMLAFGVTSVMAGKPEVPAEEKSTTQQLEVHADDIKAKHGDTVKEVVADEKKQMNKKEKYSAMEKHQGAKEKHHGVKK